MNYEEQYKQQQQLTNDVADKILQEIQDNLDLLNMHKAKLKGKFIPWITDVNTGEITTLAYIISVGNVKQSIALRKQDLITFIHEYPEETKILVLELKSLIIRLKLRSASNAGIDLLKEIEEELNK